MMASYRPGRRSFLSFLLVLLLLLAASLSSSSFYVSAYPVTANGKSQLTLEVRNFKYKFFRYDVDESKFFLIMDLAIKDLSGTLVHRGKMNVPLSVVKIDSEDTPGSFIERITSGEVSGKAFAYSLPDTLPSYVTNKPRPTIEDNMWVLQQIADGEASETDMFSAWYQTFEMDGPFRMTVYYYDGVSIIDIPAEAIGPDPGPGKKAVLLDEYRPLSFPMDFTQVVSRDLNLEDDEEF